MNKLHLVLCAIVCAAVAPMSAMTYVPPADRDLIKAADAIVVATASSSHSELTAAGRLVTIAELRVEEPLKGAVTRGAVLRLTELGGTVGQTTLNVSGAARYADGERYIVFVGTNARGELTTAGLAIGEFVIGTDLYGRAVAQRVIADGTASSTVRDAGAFIEYIRAVVAGQSGRDDYWTPAAPLTRHAVAEFQRTATPMFVRGDYLMVGNPRWQSPVATFATFGTEAGVPTAVSLTASAATAWNGAGAGISYNVSGTTTKSGGLGVNDNANEVLFDDPNHTVASARSQCGCNVIAIGGSWTTVSYPLGGETFSKITNGAVEVGTSLGLSTTQFQAAMTHEFGHTLGFRHSDGTASLSSPPPACASPSPCAGIGQAIMASVITQSIGTVLKQWDLDAAQTVYGSGPVCTPPSISAQPTGSTITAGNSATLSVTATGTAALTYQWYVGASGVTTTPVPGGTTASIQVSPSSTTQYWVRVTGQCAPTADSNAATVTVNAPACNAPQITSQPQSVQINSGSSTSLSVTATGTGLTYQWYTGTSGNTGSPIAGATGPTVNVSPTSNQNYWVQVSSSCSPTAQSNSVTAVVTVITSGCAPVQIINQPQSKVITLGQPATLSINATSTATPLTYQWYIGTSGDTTAPIAGATSFTFTVSPQTSTIYWVQVTNACRNTANSFQVQVTVNPPGCPPVVMPAPSVVQNGSTYTLTASPTGGTGLTVTWFVQGTNGNTQIGTGLQINVTPTATTTYVASAKNSCGAQLDVPVTITIAPPASTPCTAPTITQPLGQTIPPGASTTITILATGTGTLHYQWYLGPAANVANPVGIDAASFTTGAVTATTPYWVKVTNDCGTGFSPSTATASSTTITILTEPARRRSAHH